MLMFWSSLVAWTGFLTCAAFYLYYFGRIGVHLKHFHPHMWASLKKSTGIRPLPDPTGLKFSQPTQFLLTWLMEGGTEA